MLLGVYREIILLGSLRWCRIWSVHSSNSSHRLEKEERDGHAVFRFSIFLLTAPILTAVVGTKSGRPPNRLGTPLPLQATRKGWQLFVVSLPELGVGVKQVWREKKQGDLTRDTQTKMDARESLKDSNLRKPGPFAF